MMETINNEIVVQAPGRINVIGEHTDYNQGLAMPAAIDHYLYVQAKTRTDSRIYLQADNYPALEIELADLQPAPGQWHTYVQGVTAALLRRGFDLGGFELKIESEIPTGAGLSSSAALCCGTVMALDHLFQLRLKRHDMALIAQEAEHRFAGVNCGLLDQYGCLFGKKGHAILLDFQTLSPQYVPLNLGSNELLLINTGVKHELAGTAYNKRREECAEALERVQAHFPHVRSFRDVTLEQLFGSVLIQAPAVFKRARFIIEENQRVLDTAKALQANDAEAFGRLVNESHQGLSALYEVSCPELDTLVKIARQQTTTHGSRMMGGGFGGCTITLRQSRGKEQVQRILERYRDDTGITPQAWTVKPADGAKVLDERERSLLQRRLYREKKKQARHLNPTATI